MAQISRKLSNSLEGALAGGGDPATSPLYVFGPFLRLLVVAGVAQITYGASIWLVILTIAVVSGMYKLVMVWVTDGSGGSGLSEEEFGGWAVKINAGITFIEYTLTFLVSMAALVTFVADRAPILNGTFLGVTFRAYIAILLSAFTGWIVNRGPKMAAKAFGPATAGVLLLLWAMVISSVVQYGFQLPSINLLAFSPDYIGFTLAGYARILAVMTGIEIFANLVAAYEGNAQEKGRKAFGSLLIIMGTTGVTMLIVGPAIYRLADPLNSDVSVFTQTMDQLLPQPLPWLGTIVGVAVLLSACAASAQGLQNLALGLGYRHYLPVVISQRNRYGVADKPVWIEVGIVAICFLVFGTHEETYLAIYAAGVFVLLSMTGWAAARRLQGDLRVKFSKKRSAAFAGTVVAALLTSLATIIIFQERFFEGAWIYFLLLPILYGLFSYFRKQIGLPSEFDDVYARVVTETSVQGDQLNILIAVPAVEKNFCNILVPLDGSHFAEQALTLASSIGQAFGAKLTLLTVEGDQPSPVSLPSQLSERGKIKGGIRERADYLSHVVNRLKKDGLQVEFSVGVGSVANQINSVVLESQSDLIAMTTHGKSSLSRMLFGSITSRVIQGAKIPILLLRPTVEWRSRWSEFKRLLVALDGSETAEQVIPFAVKIAKQFESEIILLSVPEIVETGEHLKVLQTYLGEILQELRGNNIQAQAIVTGQGPARTIVKVSENEAADLIMIATHGRSGVERIIMGSVADRVIQETVCPVLLVPVIPSIH